MKLNDHFSIFLANISLNPDRKGRIDSACSHLTSFIGEDEAISEILYELFVQGSYAIGTAVRPLDEKEEYDVDIVLALNIHARPQDQRTPAKVIQWLATRLRTDDLYKGKIRQKKRCIRVEYAGDFHLDIVPAHCDGNVAEPLQVPDKDNGQWRSSHPRGYFWAP